jgi:hypothetical protein
MDKAGLVKRYKYLSLVTVCDDMISIEKPTRVTEIMPSMEVISTRLSSAHLFDNVKKATIINTFIYNIAAQPYTPSKLATEWNSVIMSNEKSSSKRMIADLESSFNKIVDITVLNVKMAKTVKEYNRQLQMQRILRR